jgi:cell division control protein 42
MFLLCFKVANRASFESIRCHWVPEVPFLVAGTQIDLRSDATETSTPNRKQKQRLVSTKDGARLAREMEAAKYVECSALTQEGLVMVFDEVR